MRMKQVVDFLNKQINNHDKVIVACSGGSDSMCLLYLLATILPASNIICAHVNHKVRKQSNNEYAYVESFCQEKSIIFEGLEICSKIKTNFESEARKIRYAFFESLLVKYQAKYIITAHHGDDLIETILMRLTRGSNLSGYAGIKLKDGHYLRPLLLVSKSDIINYTKEENIKYYEDYTNRLNDHTRNKYRHKIVPFLKKENKNVHYKYMKFSKELQEYDCFVKTYINEKKFIVNNQVSVKRLTCESDFVIKKVLEQMIKEVQKNDLLDVNDKNMESMLNIMKSSKSNCMISLSNGYVAKRSYDEFSIVKKEKAQAYEVIFEDYFENDQWLIKKVETCDDVSNFVIRLNKNDIKLPLIIRSRKDGDCIELKNSGHKKIKSIFIDEKINIPSRGCYPIVSDSDGNIVWIPGLKKSKFDKEKKEKYDIILFSERK